MYLLLHPDYCSNCLHLLVCGFSVFFPALWLGFLFLLLFLCLAVISEYWGQRAGKKSSACVQAQRERVLECSKCWEYPGKFMFLSAIAALHAGCYSVNLRVAGASCRGGEPDCALARGWRWLSQEAPCRENAIFEVPALRWPAAGQEKHLALCRSGKDREKFLGGSSWPSAASSLLAPPTT